MRSGIPRRAPPRGAGRRPAPLRLARPARRSRRRSRSRARRRARARRPGGRTPAIRAGRCRNPLRPGRIVAIDERYRVANLLVGAPAEKRARRSPASASSRCRSGPSPTMVSGTPRAARPPMARSTRLYGTSADTTRNPSRSLGSDGLRWRQAASSRRVERRFDRRDTRWSIGDYSTARSSAQHIER